eukprot:COSAG05_NODE_613_length_8348_cov_10.272275_1_plen_117_part_00
MCVVPHSTALLYVSHITVCEGGYVSQFSNLVQFLSHQKIFKYMHMRGKSACEFSADSKKVVTPPSLKVSSIGNPVSVGTKVRGVKMEKNKMTNSNEENTIDTLYSPPSGQRMSDPP